MARRWRPRLVHKYALTFGVLVTAALVASSLVGNYFAYTEAKATLLGIQRDKAEAAATVIEQFVNEMEAQLGWTTHAAFAPGPDGLARRRLDYLRLLRQAPPITEIAYMDRDGREQLVVSRLAIDVIGSGKDMSQEAKFKVARAKGRYIGPVYFRKESEPYMTLALAGHGGDRGVTTAEVNLKFIWDVVSRIKVGNKGHAFVVDSNGLLIAHPDISLVLRKTDLSALPQVKAARAGERAGPDAPTGAIANDLAGKEVLTANAEIAPVGWLVFVETPLNEAFAPLYASLTRTGIMLAVGIALSVAAGLLLARRMVGPIRALRAGAERVASGEFGGRIEVRTGDELEDLAGQFNRMGSQLAESYATLERKVEERTRELSEALEQQTATADVLKVISRSPTAVEPVLQTVADSAARLCNASNVVVHRIEEGHLVPAAVYGDLQKRAVDDQFTRPIGRGSLAGRAVVERQTIHVPDFATVAADYPDSLVHTYAEANQARSILATPLLREGVPIGVIVVTRTDVLPFTKKQIELVKTFADQAVIAIENVRLFEQVQARTRELEESLEQQTATADVLKVISRSTFDLQGVLDTLVGSVARLCEADMASINRASGPGYRQVASYGQPPELRAHVSANPIPPGRGSVVGRTALEGGTVQVADVRADSEYLMPDAATIGGVRTVLGVPLLREGVPIGVLALMRTSVRPFTDKQIELVKTFADQAVIAIENVRLFEEVQARTRELEESLEQQTVTSDILGVISRSLTDTQPVFDAIVQSGLKLFPGATFAVALPEGENVRLAALVDPDPVHAEMLHRRFPPVPLKREYLHGAAILDGRTVDIPDAENAPHDLIAGCQRFLATGDRAVTIMPMMRGSTAIGALSVARRAPGPLSDRQMAILKTFSDQAVIAIENVRLFEEVQARTRELEESLKQQTATSAILRAIAESTGDVKPVMQVIAENATRFCEAENVVMFRAQGDWLHHVVTLGPVGTMFNLPGLPLDRNSVAGCAAIEKRIVHLDDVREHFDEFPTIREVSMRAGTRTVVGAPMLREGNVVGVIAVLRAELRPFSRKQLDLLKSFADQAVIAIENARLLAELQTRSTELAESVDSLEALASIGQAVGASLDLSKVLDAIAEHAASLAEADASAIYSFDETARTFALQSAWRLDPTIIGGINRTPVRLGEGAMGRAALEGRPVQFPDILEVPNYSRRDLIARSGNRAVLAVPLARESRVFGALAVLRRNPGEFAPRTVALLSSFASQSALAIQNARLYQEIDEKSRQVELASQHKTQFLANMSHELRTPLNAILGYTELILDDLYGPPTPRMREVLERVQVNGKHLLGLINDVLDLSKIEAGQLQLSLADYSMKEVVHTVTTATESLATEKGLVLDAAVPADLPIGCGDERRLTQVLLNLVGNAIKFTDRGRVGISVAARNGAFEVAVADTGPGIAASEHERIFEEFHQVDSSSTREKGGTGLGLAIARRIVEMHGGRIWVESEPGHGATFRIALPVAAIGSAMQ